MNGATTGAILGAALGTGLLFVWVSIPFRRRIPLDDRVLPYLAGLQPVGQARTRSVGGLSTANRLSSRTRIVDRVSGGGASANGAVMVGAAVVGAVVGPWLRLLGDALGRVVGNAATIQRRLGRAGSLQSVEDFRI